MTATSGWGVASATTIGSFHVREHLPNQDSVRTWAADDGSAAVVVVADGHGHHSHFRSDVGSALAAEIALQTLREALPDPDPVEVGVDTVAAWRRAVLAHVEEHPMRSDEVRRGPLVPYGTTLLAMAVTDRHLVALQVGDGDTVAVRASGTSWRPLREDPASSNGVHTASLCQPDPIASLRTAVVDLDDLDGAATDPFTLAYVATDGLGKARVDADTWWRATATDLATGLRTRGLEAVRSGLPAVVREPALAGGDDTTIAVVARDHHADRAAGT